MAIDPDIRAMLDRLAAAPQQEVTLESARRDYRQQYVEMSRAPEGDVVEQAVAIPGAHPETALRLYRPTGLAGQVPVILYLHGGGFVLGDAEAYSRQSARIALECNALVAFLDYRLAPEHPFPAALEDTLLAADWITANASSIGADPSGFVLMGDSAGANLSMAVLLNDRPARRFVCACLLYPLVDARPYLGLAPRSQSDQLFATGHYLEFAETEYFAGVYLSDKAQAMDPRVSPVLAPDLGGMPPIQLYGAEYDILRDQGRDFAGQLRAAGNDVSYRCFEGLIHNFMQHSGISRRSDDAFLEVCAAVRRALSS